MRRMNNSISKKKVGFLLINTLAHAYHLISIAFELSLDKNFKVFLFISSEAIREKVDEIKILHPGNTCEIVFLKPTWYHHISRKFKKRLHPRVKNIIKNNIELLMSNDALVMTDRHIVKFDYPQKPIYICTGHGAGDRKQGFGTSYSCCDYIFVPGKAKYDRMIKENNIPHDKCRIIGYPKFDITVKKEKKFFFSNNLPIVIYNPHFNAKETSWFEWGDYILKYFKNNPNYNLIFAPHIMLYAKKSTKMLSEYKAENILIDVDSHSLSDMTYIAAADIYLGDVSSQVYEFIGIKKRPCVFLNTQKADWMNNNNYRMWNIGDVVNNIDELDNTINNVQKNFSKYEKLQQQYVEKTFTKLNETSSSIGAEAIKEILNGK